LSEQSFLQDFFVLVFFSSRRRHTIFSRDWSSDVCSSDLFTSGMELGRRIAELVDEGPVVGFIATPGQLNIQPRIDGARQAIKERSEEHTSELQSRENLVCRLLLEKKKDIKKDELVTQHSP